MLRRPIACTLLLCYLPACTSWHVEKGVSPQQVISAEHPSAVRVTRADGSHIVLHQPRIAAGDSLAGVLDGTPSSVAVSDVTQVAVRKVSAGKTIGLAAGAAVGAGIVAVIVYLATCGNTCYWKS